MARFRLELGPVPMHHQVYLDLRGSLDDGTWRPGDRLPPERELARHYGVSLITVRRALGELAQQGRIERTRGRGTYVLHPRIERDFSEALSFTAEMQRRGLDPETRLLAARSEAASESVASALDLELGSPTLYLERLRVAGGEPLLLEQVHLPGERFPGLLASDLEHESLYDLLTRRYGTRYRPCPRSPRTRPAPRPRGALARPAASNAGTPHRRASRTRPTAVRSSSAAPTFAGTARRYFIERIVVRAHTTVAGDIAHAEGTRAGVLVDAR